MKKPTILFFSILLLAACSGGKADYGKTITDHLMSKVPTNGGYSVEILDIEELPPVTVADSITILRNAFEEERKGRVEHTQGVMALARMLPEGAERQKREAALQHTIDSLVSVPVPVFYGDAPPDSVLAVSVRCRYSVSIPGTPAALTETFDFGLTPGGDAVLYQRKSK